MADDPRETVRLLQGLFTHMRQIVGEGACYAMLHSGALEEGKRFGAGADPRELPKLLARLDGALSHRTEIVRDDGDLVTLRVRASPLVAKDQRPAHGVILGLVEGALTASRAGRYRGTAIAGDDELLLELRRDAAR